MRFGFILFAIACLMNAFMTHESGMEQILASQLLRAFALPFIWAPFAALATAYLKREDAGSASGLMNVVDNLAGSVGVAMMSTLLAVREQFHSAILSETVTKSSTQQWLINFPILL